LRLERMPVVFVRRSWSMRRHAPSLSCLPKTRVQVTWVPLRMLAPDEPGQKIG